MTGNFSFLLFLIYIFYAIYNAQTLLFFIKERDSSHNLFTILLSENKAKDFDHQTRCLFSSPASSLAPNPLLWLTYILMASCMVLHVQMWFYSHLSQILSQFPPLLPLTHTHTHTNQFASKISLNPTLTIQPK